MSDLLQAIGRIAVAALFIWSGFAKLTAPGAFTAMLAAKSYPVPKILTYTIGAAEFGLGILIAIGWQTAIAAAALAAFTIAATLISHSFWTMSGEAYRVNQIQALKNLSIVGALMLLAIAGPGRFSLSRGR